MEDIFKRSDEHTLTVVSYVLGKAVVFRRSLTVCKVRAVPAVAAGRARAI
jgi:hypothetical protein